MRILHVTKKYPDALGGDSVVVSALEHCQITSGSQVAILTSNCNDIKDAPHITKFGLTTTAADLDNITPKRVASLLLLLMQSRILLRMHRPDIIHTHSIDMAVAVSFAARYYRIPIVHTFHVLTFNSNYQALLRRKSELTLLRIANPNRIIALSNNDAESLQHAGFSATVYIPNGVDTEYWRRNTTRNTNSPFTFLSVGRLETQKGFQHLIAAASILRSTNTSFKIQIVGDGSLSNQLMDQIDSLNLRRHVCLLGLRDREETRALYWNADAFVLSSLWEGMPLTILEAWAAGLPSVCTQISGLQDIGGDCAVFVPPGDASRLASAMESLILEPATRKALGLAAARRAEQYSWQAVTPQIDRVYSEAIVDATT